MYPGQFHRLVMVGKLYAEDFNMTLNIVPSALGEIGMPAVDPATLAAVAGDVATWFPKALGSGGCGLTNKASLVSLKLNRIGQNGKYVDPETMEHIYPTPVGGAATINVPPQNSTVATFRTAIARGPGSRGRIYLVPNASQVVSATDGRISAAQALQVAQGVSALLTTLNTRYALIGRVGVASEVGSGRFEHVTAVDCGRVVDTMRSRRSSLAEDYQSTPVA